jgi:pectate lyase
MKFFYTLLFVLFATANLFSQTVLFNYNFQSALPTGITANYNGGALSTTKPADGVCTAGAAVVNLGGNLQVNVASCSVFTVNMKSSGASTRAVTIKYKLQTDTAFTTLTTSLNVQLAATFSFHTLYPRLVSAAPITVSIEPTDGNIQIHDLYVEGSGVVSTAAEMTAFALPNQIGVATINSVAGTIAVNVPTGTALIAVTPTTLTISAGASINPVAATSRNFSAPAMYTVTAANGTTTKIWTITVTTISSTEKEITAFQFANQIGASVINSAAGTIAINMPTGTVVTNLIPTTLTISANATINPTVSTARNFSVPVTYTVTAQNGSAKTWTVTVNFVAAVFTLTINKVGMGNVTANPAPTNGTYADGTVVTLTAVPILNNTFTNWTGAATGTATTTTITMNSNKTITATFSSNYNLNFNQVVGFASINGDGFTGPTVGGNRTTQPIYCINSPADFNKLCEALYYRSRAYMNRTPTNGMLKAPLIILVKAGNYDASQTLSAVGANAYGNDMLDIADQGDLTFIGEGDVTFNFGINVKRSWNIIIRNISFHSYGDDGVNIGYPETHHIWLDHCTFGHPTTMPANTEIPDGTSEVKDGASFVTISWCKYQHHWKTCLMGHSDNNGATDLGRLKVTYYANYFYNTNSRHPRTRFGTAHVLNNLYENVGLGRTGQLGYGIGASNSSQVWAESNFFLDTRWPMLADRSTADFNAVYGPNLLSPNSNIQCFGLKSVNNAYDDSGLTQTLVGKVLPGMLNPSNRSIKFDEISTPQFTFNPANDYAYTPFAAADVRALIPLYAGADKVNWNVSCVPVGVQDLRETQQLKIMPSVSSDLLKVEADFHAAATLTVVDLLGRIVMTKQLSINELQQPFELTIGHLPNGFYKMVVENAAQRQIGSFVKN